MKQTEQMTDRELLELAAEAAGYDLYWGGKSGLFGPQGYWNPLKNDGDAFRLAVKLGICPACDGKQASAMISLEKVCWCDVAEVNNDPYAATRRAIVRAAAEIGKERR